MLPDLARLNDLHRFYDGEIPESERRAALLGTETVALAAAVGQRAFFKGQVTDQIRAIRKAAEWGIENPNLIPDLALYRRGWRHWHRQVVALRAAADARPA